ncbi:putative DNA-binding domain-containing protein [Acidithiobacillus sp. AMEEHan]|uniref:HvfC/BufC family peptide modification chaperone n=1 Tax=Acidithiobacillus sp. AMEEHan TaxID=2994951 RepID=UPI0027E426A6|nr:putative DNA-binding domain-containing protein [Acidithiobacillus sp. AMEEHan]
MNYNDYAMASPTQPSYAERLRDVASCVRRSHGPLPAGWSPEIFALYREMVRASFAANLEDAFPQTRRHLTSEAWETLLDDFLAHGDCPSPSFHAVPGAFCEFVLGHLEDYLELPQYLPALLHWEWLTLHLAIIENSAESGESNLAEGWMQLAPSASLQHYPFAVHQNTEVAQAPARRDCYLLIYRDRQDRVFSRELELQEARLAAALLESPHTLTEAHALAFPTDECPLGWSRELLGTWAAAGIIYVTNLNPSLAEISPSPP